MERKRRLKLQLHETEYKKSSILFKTSHHSNVYKEEILSFEDLQSDANVDMQEQEQIEQEQMENDSQSENNIPNDNNNINLLKESLWNSTEDITDSESDEFNKDVYLHMSLKEWACRGVSKRKINDLLSILRKIHPELPQTYVTLLNTPKTTALFEIDNGHVWYKGIKKNLDSFLTQEYLDTHERIQLDISIDGLPLDSSAKLHFWPIFGSLAHNKICEPFIISIIILVWSRSPQH